MVKSKPPTFAHDAERRSGESIVGRSNPALDERCAEPIRPDQLDRVMVGHVAEWVGRGEEIAAAPAARADRRLTFDPRKDVPDMDPLLDHPITGLGAAAQPATMAADRTVAAGPGGTSLDQRSQLTSADQFDSLAEPRV